MIKKIFKYPLRLIRLTDTQTIQIPNGSTLLWVAVQNDVICLWAMVDPEQAMTTRTIVIIGTGNPICDMALDYVGTVMQGPYVWHVFEDKEPKP